MNEPKKAYSYGHLITIATIADEIAIARGTVGHDELRDLAKRFASGELKTPPLFPPHQLWQHGGDASRIGAATPDPDGVWRILFKKTSKPHQSDKDAFNHPPSAYTWHMLAADVYELGQQPVWKTQTAAALRNLACRYNSDLLDEMPEPAAQQPKPAAVEALPVQPKAAAPAPVVAESGSKAVVVPFKKAALIAAHVHEWPTIERDIADANTNGLAAAAKASARGWFEDAALMWARANGKLISAAKPADSLAQAMHNLGALPSRKHTMQD